MKKNIGKMDRVARLLIGVVCLVAVFFVSIMWLKIILVALGIFSIYEALVGWCAFYMLIGRNTCPIE
jgi:hypothetical protein